MPSSLSTTIYQKARPLPTPVVMLVEAGKRNPLLICVPIMTPNVAIMAILREQASVIMMVEQIMGYAKVAIVSIIPVPYMMQDAVQIIMVLLFLLKKGQNAPMIIKVLVMEKAFVIRAL